MTHIFIGLAGIGTILLLAWLLSTDRGAIRLRVVGAAFALQAGIAVLVLYTPWGRAALGFLSGGVSNLLGYANAGTQFLFGRLATDRLGQMFALQALPVIIFFAALVSILYHLGVMQWLVRWIGGGIEKVIGVSKVESLYAAANIFVGQSEAPLVIRPYLAALSPSQLFMVMTNGMAGVAGTLLAAYAAMGVRIDYLLAASFMSAPGGLLMAKIIMPDQRDAPSLDISTEMQAAGHGDEPPVNLIMAAAQGAQTGVRLAVMVGAMMLAFVALVALANGLLGGGGRLLVSVSNGLLARQHLMLDPALADFLSSLSFERLLGYVFAPVMLLLNIPWHEAGAAGGLFGEKIVLNEFVAYIALGQDRSLSPHTVAVVTFALCGFANFSSIAVQMATTGSLAPNQRPNLARLGLRALAAGSLANLMSAAFAGLLLPV